MKLLKGAIFGTDMFMGLAWYTLLTCAFYALGMPAPLGLAALFPPVIAVIGAHLPDFDLLPYKWIMKGRISRLIIVGIAASGIYVGLSLWLNADSFIILAVLNIFIVIMAVGVKELVRERASHWPILHHPIPVIIGAAGLAGAFTSDFASEHFLYYELLVVPLVIAHFLHDGIQPQGHPFLSPISNDHYRWRPAAPLRFEAIPNELVSEFYYLQVKREETMTGKEDLERRAEKVTVQTFLRNSLVAISAGIVMILFVVVPHL